VKTSKPAIAISLLIIGLGIGWLLNTMRVFGGQIDWIWVSGLGLSGIWNSAAFVGEVGPI
jgi:hypothetical protein